MTLKEKISADFKQAFKNKEMKKKDILAMLLSEIRNKEIELKKRETGLDDQEVVALVARAIKQRIDSASQFRQGEREDLALAEEAELGIIKDYMPAQLSETEVEKTVEQIITTCGAQGKNDMGKVMGLVMNELKGKADGNLVRLLVEKKLSI